MNTESVNRWVNIGVMNAVIMIQMKIEIKYCPKCNKKTHVNNTMGSKLYIVCDNYGFGCDFAKRICK